MKASLITLGCILLSAAACTAPQGKKLTADNGGLAPVAAGPTTGAATLSTNLTAAQSGQVVSLARNGTVTVMLDADQSDGYTWRLSEIPDPTVLKLVSQDFVPPTSTAGRGQEKWVFQAMGDGEVDVKMWYGNMRLSSMSGNPSFDFVASVTEETKPEKKTKKSKKA